MPASFQLIERRTVTGNSSRIPSGKDGNKWAYFAGMAETQRRLRKGTDTRAGHRTPGDNSFPPKTFIPKFVSKSEYCTHL